ncbi:MAG: hypothetical protein AB1426_01075 [Bacillota bacterium]
MHPKKGWLTLAMVGLLAALLVGTGVAWAKNKVEPVKRSVVQASENNLVPQEIKDDTGGARTGKIVAEPGTRGIQYDPNAKYPLLSAADPAKVGNIKPGLSSLSPADPAKVSITKSGEEILIGDSTAKDAPICLGVKKGPGTSVPNPNAPTSKDVTTGDGSPTFTEAGEKPAPAQVNYPGPKGEAGTLATYYIQGTLNPSESDYYGPWYFSPGETVTVSLSWTPTSSSVDVGLQSASTGTYYYVTCTGGACSYTFQINKGDNYYVRLRDRGPDAIYYTGYLTI